MNYQIINGFFAILPDLRLFYTQGAGKLQIAKYYQPYRSKTFEVNTYSQLQDKSVNK